MSYEKKALERVHEIFKGETTVSRLRTLFSFSDPSPSLSLDFPSSLQVYAVPLHVRCVSLFTALSPACVFHNYPCGTEDLLSVLISIGARFRRASPSVSYPIALCLAVFRYCGGRLSEKFSLRLSLLTGI